MRMPLYDPQTDRVLSPVYPFHECAFLTPESIYRHPPELDVSVVVPCYNAERFLPGCLESLAAQQASCSYEVILVDDGSWDRTGELLEKAAAENSLFRCLRQENGGAAAARNAGMREARGEYLLFVDADDVVSPNYVQALLDCARAGDAYLGVCAYYSFTGEGKHYKTVRWDRKVGTADLNGTPWGKLFHRKLFDRLLWPSGYWYEDTVLAFLVYPRVHRIASTNLCEYGYRSSVENATHTGRKSVRALDSLYITDLVLRAMEDLRLEAWLDSAEGQERLINQFYLNQCRIQNLPSACRREVFRLQSAYTRQLLTSADRPRRFDSALYAEALWKNSAELGETAVRLEKAGKALRLVKNQAAGLLRGKKTEEEDEG